MILSNYNGTMADRFSIGKNGPTIHQGTSDPNLENMVGVVGDLYVQLGAMPTLYQFRSSRWIDIAGEVFTRTPVVSASFTAGSGDFYLGIRSPTGCTINLPAGEFGKKYIIKDEIGSATDSAPIVIVANGSETIDGEPSTRIITSRSSLTMVYGAEWHII